MSKQALREIAKLEGPFKRDRLEHCQSVVENLERIAKEAIALECDGAFKITNHPTVGDWQLPEWSR